MAGKIKKIIDSLIEKRSHGNLGIAYAMRVKLILKGVHPDDYTETSEDDPVTIARVKEIARELGITI